jgi:hypothetical protein
MTVVFRFVGAYNLGRDEGGWTHGLVDAAAADAAPARCVTAAPGAR